MIKVSIVAQPTLPKHSTMKKVFSSSAFLLCGLLSLTSFVAGGGSSAKKEGKFGPLNQVCAGVNIHFVAGHEKELDLIAAAGFKFIRTDLSWQGIERTKGEYNWTAFDELTNNLEKRGLRAIYILDYSNSLYEETVVSKNPLTGKEQKSTASPQHPESIDAFARWAAATVGHFKDRRIVWEIWNEPNISFWKPGPKVEQYNAVALATGKAVRAADPDAILVGPGTSGVPMPFLEAFAASGVLEYLDGVSVHPYRNYAQSPETAEADYRQLRALIDRYAPTAKKGMPIISSEWGYSSATKGVSPEKQAENAVRMQLANLLNGVPLSIWYDWKNDGNDPADHEQNFGTVTSDLNPKPAYRAFQLMHKELQGYFLVSRLDLGNRNDFALLFRNGKKKYKICAWTMGEPHTVVPSKGLPKIKKAGGVDGNGNALKLQPEQGKLSLELKSLPQYITVDR